MSTIKSFSVGNGDTFYIDHNTANFTIIDCNLKDEDKRKDEMISEINNLSTSDKVTRFVSTHPDDDHFHGIKSLDDEINILNFYCGKNEATKSEDDDHFKHYKSLRDSDKAFYLFKGCSRKWMNVSDAERKHAGLHCYWPITDNTHYKDALKKTKDGESPNNISIVLRYRSENGGSFLWMGDLETEFMENVSDHLEKIPQTDILFAPHHGRESGKVPTSILEKIKPEIIIIGEAPSKHLNYYSGYNTITQNSAGDIVFENEKGKIHIFTSKDYSVDFLDNESQSKTDMYYLGTLNVKLCKT